MKPETRLRLRCASLALLAALAACGDAKTQNAQASAGGQVLEASVSDAMLPVDRVSSQPPLAPKSGGDSDKSDKRPNAGDSSKGSARPARSEGADAPAAEAVSGDEGDASAEATPDEE